MKIQTKLILGSSVLIVVAMLSISLILGVSANKQLTAALEETSTQNLIAIRNSSGQRIDVYFRQVKSQILSMSTAPNVVKAAKSFRFTFDYFIDSVKKFPDKQTQKSHLRDYYLNHYAKHYETINNGKTIDIDALINGLNDTTVALQYQYISNNPHPLGSKGQLEKINDFSSYSKIHAGIHKHMSEFANYFGFYDIFIVDPETGMVLYSVYKELDYATSLIDGPYANSGLGEAFRRGNELTDSKQVIMTDFSPYTPSYEAQASFMATPMFSRGKKIAVLIFQMPIEEINKITTGNQLWKANGLGETGETILVGNDKTARTNSRLLLEDRDAYYQAMEKTGVDSTVIQGVKSFGSNIGLHEFNNDVVDEALSGKIGVKRYTKYTGYDSIAAYMSIEVFGNKWALISEINYDEATSAAKKLASTLAGMAIWVSVAIVGMTIGLAWFFSRQIASPIIQTVQLFKNIAQGEGDLTVRLQQSSKDELGELARWFNTFIEQIQNIILKVRHEASGLEQTANEMTTVSKENIKGAEKQQKATEEVAESMRGMDSVVQDVSDSASLAEEATTKVSDVTKIGADVVNKTTDSIIKVSKDVKKATEIMIELDATSDEIGSVVGVINSIAEQTNLLALNAAIEAARAGEQGRGFAVVADEVRALASRTQESTLEINSIIEKLQQSSTDAVKAMNSGYEAVDVCVGDAEQARQSLEDIKLQIEGITEMNLRIASNSKEQTKTSHTITENISDIDVISKANFESAASVSKGSQNIITSTTTLSDLIGQFKV